jgi:polar amino acid transport system substrate-binding protein
MQKNTWLLTVLLCLTSLISSVHNAHAVAIDRAPVKKTITIAADEWCPINCKPGTSQLGVGIDLAKRAFEPLGIEVRYVVMPWSEALAQVRTGKVDAVVGANYADDKTLVFPSQAITTITDDFYVLKGDAWRFQGVYTLKNKKVGVIEGYGYSDTVQKFIDDNKGGLGLVQAASGNDALKKNMDKLRAKQIDVLVESKAVMEYAMQAGHMENQFMWAGGVPQDKVYVAFSPALPASKELAVQFDAAVQKMSTSGELATLYKSYGMQR